jgi:paraquat-inducible protein B
MVWRSQRLILGRGGSSWKPRFVLYFKESVKGLNIGSPVTFRGVNVGTVTNIQLIMGVSESDIRIPVIIEINTANFLRSERMVTQMTGGTNEQLKGLIDAGLRAQLQLQSLLTGQLFIQLDFNPGTPAEFVGDERYPEIPTIRTPIEKITGSDFPVERVMNNLISTSGLKRLVNSRSCTSPSVSQRDAGKYPPAREVAEHRNPSRRCTPLDDLGSRAIDSRLNAGSEMHATLDARAMLQARGTLEASQRLVSDEKLLYAIDNALAEITSAARSVRDLTDFLERQPQSILRGKVVPGGD